jgi:hypothetical protein
MKKNELQTETQKKQTRMAAHLSFAIVFFICVLIFKWINDKSIITIILKLAGYTYGPLLGLFAFGIVTKRTLPKGPALVLVCIAAPVICYILSDNAARWFSGFQIGIELLILNGLLTFLGLWMISRKPQNLTTA